jgi:hypothetical protein
MGVIKRSSPVRGGWAGKSILFPPADRVERRVHARFIFSAERYTAISAPGRSFPCRFRGFPLLAVKSPDDEAPVKIFHFYHKVEILFWLTKI